MIKDKSTLKDYLACDIQNYKQVAQPDSLREWFSCRLLSSPIGDQTKIWDFIKTLRKCEYWGNTFNSNPFRFLLGGGGIYLFYLHKLRRLSRITGFQIPPNTVGKGLTIWHWGFIIINPYVRIGDYCTLQPGVVIGHKEEGAGAPQIGNHVTIGSGARIIGNIKIGDDVNIAPNAVVVHDVPSHSIVAGIPARIIKQRTKLNANWEKYSSL